MSGNVYPSHQSDIDEADDRLRGRVTIREFSSIYASRETPLTHNHVRADVWGGNDGLDYYGDEIKH